MGLAGVAIMLRGDDRSETTRHSAGAASGRRSLAYFAKLVETFEARGIAGSTPN